MSNTSGRMSLSWTHNIHQFGTVAWTFQAKYKNQDGTNIKIWRLVKCNHFTPEKITLSLIEMFDITPDSDLPLMVSILGDKFLEYMEDL